MDYSKLFKNIPEAIVVLSPEYKILEASDRYLQVTMRKREQIIGLHFLLEAYPDKEHSYEDNPVRKVLDKARQTKQTEYLDVIRYDLPRPGEDGGGYDTRYWEAAHTPVLDDEGNVEYLIQRTSDVTDREVAKMALSESEEKFRFMAEVMPQLIFTTDAQGNPIYFNQRWTKLTGVPIKELMGRGWVDVVHPDDLALTEAKWQEAFAKGTEMQLEYRLREKDGDYRWYLCRALPMTDESGKIIMWVGSSTDIHNTRRMVQELLEANEQMAHLGDQVQAAYTQAENERKTMERLIMQAPAMFCILKGPNHRFELVNKQYQQQLFPQRELVNKTVAEALPEVIEQGFIQLLDDVYNTGKEFVAEEVLIKLDRHNTGKLEDVYVTFIYQPLYDEAEQITGILVFAFEVTQQVLYKKKLQELGQA
ncbi:PAS domain-containing protein [Pontibacter sp. 172403-2]|uniref:PAS domain-containing protein n=1 Tax=Pontibacter rufus TaxID=2791028 RepID=UPI0018AFEE2F|nr:PAS domain-containing protein [Pontibacter sp. 172403-2]MBF9252629.1 PAS domain-containing protein [Pontibacter sp. 172403-2]